MPRRWLCLIPFALNLVLVAGDALAGTGSYRRGAVPADFQVDQDCPLPEELDLLELINAHREVNGRQPLALSTALTAAARHHAESMASFDYFDYALVPEGIDFAQNIANFGYEGTYLGANIAAGPSSERAATVFSQWLASPSQRDNLLNPGFVAIGLGSASNPDASFEHYWAAAFGELASDPIDPECEAPFAESPASQTDTATATTTVELPGTPTEGAGEATMTTGQGGATATGTAFSEGSPTASVTLNPTFTATPGPDSTAIASPVATLVANATATGAATATTTLLASPSPVPGGSPAVGTLGSPVGMPGLSASPVGGAACSADRDNARAADRVVIRCTGFLAGEELALYWDQPREESLFTSGEAADDGTGELSFLAPETPAGPYVVIVRGKETLSTASVTLEIRPGLFVLPESGDPGDVITADLTGFQPGEAVTLNWYVDETETRVLRVVSVGEDGSLTTTFRAPASPAGPHAVSAVGIRGGRADATFAIEGS